MIDPNDEANINTEIPERASMDKICNSSGNKLLDLCQCTDLKIANGRYGDDAGVGDFTYISNKGKSLIDYVIMSHALFSLIENFIVHDLYTFSQHKPIQVNFHVHCERPTVHKNTNTSRLKWDESCNDQFKNVLFDKSNELRTIANDIMTLNFNFDEGIKTFTDKLYSITTHVHRSSHTTDTGNNNTCRSKTNISHSPWFDKECALSRAQLRQANNTYRRHTTVRC